MGLTASAVGERIALVWSLSQLLRELDINSLECPPHMSDVLPMQMQVRCIHCHRRRCNCVDCRCMRPADVLSVQLVTMRGPEAVPVVYYGGLLRGGCRIGLT